MTNLRDLPRPLLLVFALFVEVAHGSPPGEVYDRAGIVLARIYYEQSGTVRRECAFGGLAGHVLFGLHADALPKPGERLYLTLDAKLQHAVERSLDSVDTGAVVFIQPSTGEVLAMASKPFLNPKMPPSNQTLPTALGAYSPGSTFLPVSGLAVATDPRWRRQLDCHGSVWFEKHGMKCNYPTGHGTHTMSGAISSSCRSFFYQLMPLVGMDALARVGGLMGLGKVSGLPIADEQAGILPTPEWLKTTYRETWTPKQTANTAGGQGYVLASPLQMALVCATIAESGRYFRPQLLLAKEQAGGAKTVYPSELLCDLRKEEVAVEGIEEVRLGMRMSVQTEKGSRKKLRIKGLDLAGKGGMSQYWSQETEKNVSKTNNWFLGFAPYEKPQLSFCAFSRNRNLSSITFDRAISEITKQAMEGRLPELPQPGG